MELTDTHCHIYLPEFDEDRKTVMEKAIGEGITRIFLPNVDNSTAPALLRLSDQYPANCFPVMGLHPTSVNENFQEEINFVRSMLETRKFYGIGETGIDLYWDKTYQKEQEEAFLIQLGWASEMDMPIIIHTRESHNETIRIIEESRLSNLKGIFHCFSGTADQAKQIIGMGFHLGIGGVSTFKNSTLGEVLPHVDPEWIVLETDSPYLAPVPYRGKRNEPSYLALTAARVAQIYDMPVAEITRITTENSKRLFGI